MHKANPKALLVSDDFRLHIPTSKCGFDDAFVIPRGAMISEPVL